MIRKNNNGTMRRKTIWYFDLKRCYSQVQNYHFIKFEIMKFLLVALLTAQIYGALCTSAPLAEQRGLMDIWDFISPAIMPIAVGIDNALATVSSIQDNISNAVTDAVHGVTAWIGGILPPLGKRDLEVNVRVNLLAELKSFQKGFQQLVMEIAQTVLNGKFVAQFRTLITKFSVFLRTHLNAINTMITNLIPTIQDVVGTQAISSCLKAVQAIEEAIKKIQALFSL